jgi:hypothetical protein
MPALSNQAAIFSTSLATSGPIPSPGRSRTLKVAMGVIHSLTPILSRHHRGLPNRSTLMAQVHLPIRLCFVPLFIRLRDAPGQNGTGLTLQDSLVGNLSGRHEGMRKEPVFFRRDRQLPIRRCFVPALGRVAARKGQFGTGMLQACSLPGNFHAPEMHLPCGGAFTPMPAAKARDRAMPAVLPEAGAKDRRDAMSAGP